MSPSATSSRQSATSVRFLTLFLAFSALIGATLSFQTTRPVRGRNEVVSEMTLMTSVSVQAEEERSAAQPVPKGKVGKWEYVHGNWVLRPPSLEAPRAVLHFLGGALVGASPHITYRYMLERLAEKGFLVIATPFQLSFDHLQSCDEVITCFEKMAPSIARQYGAIPVVGVGHSCGALLQLLITSLFPDTPRAANALISFNNKPVSDAVPFFEEVFAPFFTTLATNNGTLPATSNEVLSLSLQLAKAATEGTMLKKNKLTC